MQTGVMAKFGEFDRIGHAFALRGQARAFIAVHHDEIYAQGLEFGNHLGTMLTQVGSTLLGRWCVALTTVTPNAEQQRFPTPRHHDPVTLQPIWALIQR